MRLYYGTLDAEHTAFADLVPAWEAQGVRVKHVYSQGKEQYVQDAFAKVRPAACDGLTLVRCSFLTVLQHAGRGGGRQQGVRSAGGAEGDGCGRHRAARTAGREQGLHLDKLLRGPESIFFSPPPSCLSRFSLEGWQTSELERTGTGVQGLLGFAACFCTAGLCPAQGLID